MPNADVFISYRRDQREQVLIIADRLQDLGLSVWFDARLEAGSSFDEEINREVRSAKVVFVCWSPEAMQSRWVRAEASIGLERDVLVAAFLHPTELMPPYNLVHAANLEGWSGAHDDPQWGQVLNRVGRLVGRPDLADIARARTLEAKWLDADARAREDYHTAIAEARRRFAAMHQAQPALFEQKLVEMGAAFESWMAKRRLGGSGAPPNPLALAEDEGTALRTELKAARAETSAALAELERVKRYGLASAPTLHSPAAQQSASRNWWPALALGAGAVAVIFMIMMLQSQQVAEEPAYEDAATATEEAAAPVEAAVEGAAPYYDYAAPADPAAAPAEAVSEPAKH
jgi:hypothetical protein